MPEDAGTVAGTDANSGASALNAETPPVVFISFAHESQEHDDMVRDLYWLLRNNGVDAKIDFPAAEVRQDWPSWMSRQLRRADYILVIASPLYRLRAEEEPEPDPHAGGGLGVRYEASLIQGLLYDDKDRWFGRVLPVLLPGYSPDHIPDWLGRRSSTSYQVTSFDDAGIDRLLRVMLDQPWETVPPLGRRPRLPPRPYGPTPMADGGRERSRPAPAVTQPGAVDLPLSAAEKKAFVDELAMAFASQEEMDLLLDEVEFARARRAGGNTPYLRWTANLREMTKGAIDQPYRQLLLAALELLPANAIFLPLARQYGLRS